MFRQGTTEQTNRFAWAIDPKTLRTGDVILSKCSSLVSLGIRLVTRSSVSHAALHVGAGFIIEAVDGGVRRIHVRSIVYDDAADVHILRPKEAEDAQCEAASEHARTLLHRPYSKRGALGTKISLCRVDSDPGRFCSQLVAESLHSAQIPFTKQAVDEVTPGDLLASPFFERVDLAKRKSSFRALTHALKEMQPLFTMGHDWNAPNQISAEKFEELARIAAEKAMKQHSCFRHPYSFYDALRQMADVNVTHHRASAEVDAAILDAIRNARAAFGDGVEPRPSIPGVIIEAPHPDLVLLYQAADDYDASETERLHDELLNSRDWDMEEWRQSTDELRSQHEATELHSLNGALFWMLGDFDRVEATYRWLAGEN